MGFVISVLKSLNKIFGKSAAAPSQEDFMVFKICQLRKEISNYAAENQINSEVNNGKLTHRKIRKILDMWLIYLISRNCKLKLEMNNTLN